MATEPVLEGQKEKGLLHWLLHALVQIASARLNLTTPSLCRRQHSVAHPTSFLWWERIRRFVASSQLGDTLPDGLQTQRALEG